MRRAAVRALLTGHSRGLGAAIAETLLEQGIEVLALARASQGGLRARYPGQLQEVALDLADAQALQAWLETDALRTFLDGVTQALLINNAGMLDPVGPLHLQEAALVARAVTLNVAAPLMLAGAFVQACPVGADRRILHVSSGAGRHAYGGWSVYCATKAALDRHAEAVCLDGVAGLHISSVAPGVIDTDMQAGIRACDPARFPARARFEALKDEGQLSLPSDCARRLVAYLRSDAFGRVPVTDLREL